jgi:hypothetical protein
VSQKIVGNFVVGTVYTSNEIGQWSGSWIVRRYGVNNGRILALKTVPELFSSCEQAAERAMELGEHFAKALDPDNSDGPQVAIGSGDELFIPPSAGQQRADAATDAAQR